MTTLTIKKFAPGQVEYGLPLGEMETESFPQVLRGDRIIEQPDELETGDALELGSGDEYCQYQVAMISSESIWLKLLSVVPSGLEN